MTKYPVLDETGKVRKWLDEGRGVDVWQSQEIGSMRPDILTPHGAPKPHWAYQVHLSNVDPDVLTFYHPVGIVRSWHDTPQGNRAAARALAKDYPDTTREAPGGTFAQTYTLAHYTMGSITIRPEADGGTTLRYRADGETHPTLLDVEFRVGILEWSARVDLPVEGK